MKVYYNTYPICSAFNIAPSQADSCPSLDVVRPSLDTYYIITIRKIQKRTKTCIFVVVLLMLKLLQYFLLVTSYVSALGQLRAVLYYALKLVNYCQDGELFVDEGKLNNEIAEQLVLDVETLSQESFYGRCLGFQVKYFFTTANQS